MHLHTHSVAHIGLVHLCGTPRRRCTQRQNSLVRSLVSLPLGVLLSEVLEARGMDLVSSLRALPALGLSPVQGRNGVSDRVHSTGHSVKHIRRVH